MKHNEEDLQLDKEDIKEELEVLEKKEVKKESNICKVCLKENHFCTCVGAEVKHKAHHDKIRQSMIQKDPNEPLRTEPLRSPIDEAHRTEEVFPGATLPKDESLEEDEGIFGLKKKSKKNKR